MSTSNNSPQNFLGGTWTRIQGQFLLGASSTYAAGSSGGEAKHTLTTSEMPEHGHTLNAATAISSGGSTVMLTVGVGGSSVIGSRVSRTGYSYSNTSSLSVSNSGSGGAHNNMPPYLAVYIRKRTA